MTDATVTGPAREEGPLMEGPPAIRRTHRNKKAAISSNGEGTQSPENPSMHEDTGETDSPVDLSHACDIPMNDRLSSVHDYASCSEIVEKPLEFVDTPVPGALDDSAMSGKPVLRDELERMEARIAEIRKEELGVDDRLAEIQREKDDLVEARAALEEAAVLMRQRLGRPAPSIVVQLTTNRPTRPQPAIVVPRKTIRQGTRRDQFLSVIKPLLLENGGSAGRQAIRQAWLEAGLFEDVENVDSSLSAALHHLKNAGHITTDYRGTWTWIGLR
jgi:hypothetical protein